MNLPGTFRLQKHVLLSALVLLVLFSYLILESVYFRDAKAGLIVLPVLGWLLFGGLLVWFSLEKDAGNAWMQKLEKYNAARKGQSLKQFIGLAQWRSHAKEDEDTTKSGAFVPEHSNAKQVKDEQSSGVRMLVQEEIELQDEPK